MRLPGRNVQRVSAAVVFLIAGCAGEAAGQQEPGAGDPSAAAGGPPARSAGAQMRVPRVQPADGRSAENWSFGFRINWNVFRSSPIGIEDRHSLVTQCVEGGVCLSSAASSSVFPANGGGNPGRMSPTGIMLDAGRMIAPGTELGVGLDVLSYTDTNDLSQGSFAGSTAGALRMVAGEHVQQMDLAGRVTYTFRVPDGAPAAQRRAWRRIGPYVGVGAGVSRYALRPPDGYPGAHRAVLSPVLSVASPASVHGTATPIRGWAPNVQVYTGATMRPIPWLPVIDVDLRYVHLATGGIGMGSFRFGTGFRHLF